MPPSPVPAQLPLRRRGRLRATALGALAASVAVVALAACSGGGSTGGDLPVTGSTSTTRPAPTTTAAAAPTTSVAGEAGEPGAVAPRFTRFEVADPAPCTGPTATASVTFEVADATTVAFAVDQVSVTGGPDVPVSGSYPVPVPCDGRSHTVLAVAVGPGGQAVASGAATAVRA